MGERARGEEEEEGRPWPRRWWVPAWLAAAAFLLYCANCRSIGAIDTASTELVPIVLLTQGNLDLAEFDLFVGGSPGASGFAKQSRWGYLPKYPVATGLALTPLYALPVAVYTRSQPTLEQWLTFARRAGKLAAAALAAASVAVFLLLARQMGAGRGLAFALTVAYALGTSAWSISSQALWQHGPGTLLLLLTALLAARQDEQPTVRRAFGIGLAGGLAIAIRLTNTLFVLPLTAWLLWRQRRYAVALLAPMAALTIAVLLYNLAVFGRLFGLYGAGLFGGRLAPGLAGVFLSPGRGLLVYFPLALLGLAGAAKCARRSTSCRPLWQPLAMFVALHALLVGKFVSWWGGVCFGPRLMTEVQPVLLLLAIPLFASPSPRRRALVLGLAGVLFAWSAFAQAVGAFLYSSRWDGSPAYIDSAPERLWDWRDNPIARDLTDERLRWAVFRPRPLSDFRAEYAAPSRAAARAGETLEIPVRLRNIGSQRWLPYSKDSPPQGWAVNLSYHFAPWVAPEQRQEGGRTILPEIVSPGEEIVVPLRVVVPEAPGEYLIEISLVQELVDWFEIQTPPARLRLAVAPSAPAR